MLPQRKQARDRDRMHLNVRVRMLEIILNMLSDLEIIKSGYVHSWKMESEKGVTRSRQFPPEIYRK